MRKGLAVSLLLHAAILIWAIAVFPSAREVNAPQPVPVEIVTPSDLTRTKAGEKQAEKDKPVASKEPEKVRVAKKESPKERRAAVREPAPKPADPVREPAPKKAAEKAKPAHEPAPKKTAHKAPAPPVPTRKPAAPAKFTEPLKPNKPVAAKPKPVKPKRKKDDFSADRIAALLNKAPDAARRTAPATADRPKKHEPEKPAQGRREGQDLRMTMSEIDALRARISQCWNPPVGGLGAQALRVRLRLQLNRDGMLAERPQVVNRETSPFFQAAADSAVRAVMLCQPYALPAEKFALWRDMILNFDPREMLGG